MTNSNTSFNLSNTPFIEGRSSIGASTTARSEKDAEDFVRYLLEGSGAEDKVDYNALRSELESFSTSKILLDQEKSFHGTDSLYLLEPQDESTATHSNFHGSPIQGHSFSKFDNSKYNESNRSISTTSFVKGQSQDAKESVIQFLSNQLISQGFPPLHPSLFTRQSSTGDMSISLSSTQLEIIKNTIGSILEEYNRRGETLQTLLCRVSEAETSYHELRNKIGSDANHDLESVDKIVLEYKNEISNLKSQCTKLLIKCNDLGKRNNDLEKERNEVVNAIQKLKREKLDLNEKISREHSRNEDVFTEIIGKKPSNSGTDRLILQIISVYEEKLGKLNTSRSSILGSGEHNRPPLSQSIHSEKDDPIVSLEKELQLYNLSSLSSSNGMIQDKDGLNSATVNAFKKHIENLKMKWQESVLLYNESQSQVELLKLQLLSAKKSEWLHSVENLGDKKQTTLERIKHDKKAWKMKLYQLEGLESNQYQELITNICQRLCIESIENLDHGLDKIESVIRLLPQMEHFIREIDRIVKNYKASFIDAMDASSMRNNSDPEKITILISQVEEWGQSMIKLAALKKFSNQVHSSLDISEKSGSGLTCLEKLNELSKNVAQSVETDTAHQAIQHFRDLFEIRSSAGVLPKMNELYVFWAEVNAGLGRLRDLLSLDGAIQPGRVLIHASEVIESGQVNAINPSSSSLPLNNASIDTIRPLYESVDVNTNTNTMELVEEEEDHKAIIW